MNMKKSNRSEADGVRRFLLIDELDFAFALIRNGATRFQARQSAVQSSSVEVFLLSSGLERFLKVCILAIVRDREGQFPDDTPWQRGNSGHNLVSLFNRLDSKSREAGSDGPKSRIKGSLFSDIVAELGDFAETGRYHNIDLVLGKRGWMDNPRFSMARLEQDVLSSDPSWKKRTSDTLANHYARMANKIITAILDGVSTILAILEDDLATDYCRHIGSVASGRVEDLKKELGFGVSE